MVGVASGATAYAVAADEFDAEFRLDVRVIEASQPVSGLLLSTSDNCGSTCEGTACVSYTGDPS